MNKYYDLENDILLKADFIKKLMFTDKFINNDFNIEVRYVNYGLLSEILKYYNISDENIKKFLNLKLFFYKYKVNIYNVINIKNINFKDSISNLIKLSISILEKSKQQTFENILLDTIRKISTKNNDNLYQYNNYILLKLKNKLYILLDDNLKIIYKDKNNSYITDLDIVGLNDLAEQYLKTYIKQLKCNNIKVLNISNLENI